MPHFIYLFLVYMLLFPTIFYDFRLVLPALLCLLSKISKSQPLSATPAAPGFTICIRSLLVSRIIKSMTLIPDTILESPWRILTYAADLSTPDFMI